MSDLEQLRQLRTQFDSASRLRRQRLLTGMARKRLTDAALISELHEILLFHAAYPDDPQTLRATESALRQLSRSARSLRDQDAKALENTGIAGTVLQCAYSVDCASWLVDRFPRDVEIDWTDGSAGEALEEMLPLLAAGVEYDGTIDDGLSTQDWIRLARGKRARSDLAWLLERFKRLDATDKLRDRLFESLELMMRWRLQGAESSRTWIRFPARPIYFQQEPLLRGVDVRAVLATPLPRPRRMPRNSRRELLDACRATLAVRHRETDPITYANPNEIYLFSLERGIDVAIIGMLPERRMPIESFFGFVAARNRVPMAYGGGWVFGDRCEIGVNVFDTFRGGESAFAFAQVLRCYHQFLGGRLFLVDPFQFGAENREGIQSGAYWFYDRLGFRPITPKLARLADAEREQMRLHREYRSPAKVLRRLAQDKLLLDVRTSTERKNKLIELKKLSLGVTRWIGRRFDGDREAATRWATARIKRQLGIKNAATWPVAERNAFEQLSLLFVQYLKLSRWTPAEKKDLVALMRGKGSHSERLYVGMVQHNQRLIAELEMTPIE